MDQKVSQQLFSKMSRDPYAQFMGIELLEVKPGYSRLSMTVGEHQVNFHGMPHGGAIFSLADAAFAAASNSHGQTAVALTMNISFLSAVPVGTKLFAEAQEEKLGRRTALYHMTVTMEDGDLVASCHGMVYRRKEWFIEGEDARPYSEGT
jgi:acyl-CoA thioesterase